MSFYAEDLAHVHDTGWRAFADAAGPGIVARLRAAGIDGGLVISLACGSGLVERALADAGYEIHGIDISGAMLELARRRVPEGTFVEASVLDADLPPCAAVVAAGEGLGYLRDPRLSDDALLRTLFTRVHAALPPGGLFLFDLVEEQRANHHWFEGPDYVLAIDTTAVPGAIERRIVLFRQVGDAWRRSDEIHRTQLRNRDAVTTDLTAAGFTVHLFAGYAEGTPLRPGVVGYAAKRSTIPPRATS